MTLIAPRTASGDAGLGYSARIALPKIETVWIVVGLITIGGFALRLAAARGDLWLDELWSLDLVSHITSPDQVFWNIPHDNNHALNSLWMYLVGQNASPLAYRLPAVLFGTAAIPVAARIGARVNAAASVAAALLTAVSYPFVDYGSEARGYAGLILAILLAMDLGTRAVDRRLDDGRKTVNAGGVGDAGASRRVRWLLAATILFGTCSHLTMLVEAAVLALATAVRLKIAGLTVKAALDETIALFRPSLLLLLPFLAALGAGTALHKGFTVGGFLPFTVPRYVRGYGGLLHQLLGLPGAVPDAAAFVLAGALVAAGLTTGFIHRRWLALSLTAMVVWPAAILLVRVPNTEYARYFLTAGLVLPVLLAEMAGRLWARGTAARLVAVAGVAAICAGQAPAVVELLTVHRGSPAAAVALMAADGPATFVARNTMITEPVVDVYATRIGAVLTPADRAERCRAPATWVVYDADYGETVPDTPQLTATGCAWRYAQVAAFPAALWSGRSWTIYRRMP